MKSLHMATYTLMAVGALNWGLVGLFKFNLVESIFGSWPSLLMLVYVLVGASAVYEFATHMSNCKLCGKK
ncbi:hypothetical protein A3D03_05650 [Candidatus Gottesmanbacteria bacterium RIFCSPHIGHO2_02_FULL_40_13]|uniref:DUF378 domain-containing protein n=1 Tax=Candidatus Gottesmanbacteria bacterium RIFCSPHIGHO2_02_FULL_40_13 TaxID=1798384 RepID=A0A1F6A9W8_9BACT|nr:MAG: hypothetical protein A3D03_05650 [Candidatus Gottesmanbacteria bacterium RIFCSPHIGHO2_02_FULL_40_13]